MLLMYRQILRNDMSKKCKKTDRESQYFELKIERVQKLPSKKVSLQYVEITCESIG